MICALVAGRCCVVAEPRRRDDWMLALADIADREEQAARASLDDFPAAVGAMEMREAMRAEIERLRGGLGS